MAKVLSNVGIRTGQPVEAHHVSQSINALTAAEAYDISISGSFDVNGTSSFNYIEGTLISGAFIGDGSGLTGITADTASFVTASNVQGIVESASYALTASFALNSPESDTASFAIAARSAEEAVSASYATTASYALLTNIISASYAVSASYIANVSPKRETFTATSSITVNHNLDTENVFVQTFRTDTINPTLFVPDQVEILSENQVKVSFAADTTGYVIVGQGGFFQTGSVGNAITASFAETASFALAASAESSSFAETSSYALTASHALNVPDTASYALTASYILESISASIATTASYIDPSNINAHGTQGNIQFNNGGDFSSNPNFYFDTGSDSLVIGTSSLAEGRLTVSGRISQIGICDSVALGRNALDSNLTGTCNVAIGFNALTSVLTGTNNTAIGANSLTANAGSCNTAIGAKTLQNTTGTSNTAIGVSALTSNITGTSNIGIGTCAAHDLTGGHFNIAIGHQSLVANETGECNIAIGCQALCKITGNYNVGLGDSAIFNITGGSMNVAIGRSAGRNATSNSTSNVFIGNCAGPTTSGVISNKLYISNQVSNNPLIYGDFDLRQLNINGQLTACGLQYPENDGSSGQVLQTNGGGVLEFADVTATTASYINSFDVDGPLGHDSIRNSETASYAHTASLLLGSIESASYAATASHALNASAESSSFATTSSFALTASHALNASAESASYATTSSFAITASHLTGQIESASYALTASYAITSSHEVTFEESASYSDTASVAITSSYALTASHALNATAESASYATTASHALTASVLLGSIESASFATTASHAITASFVESSSYALTASHVPLLDTVRQDFSSTSLVNVNHSLNNENVLVQVYQVTGSNHRLITPSEIIIEGPNDVRIELVGDTTGYVVVGESGYVTSGSIQNAVSASHIDLLETVRQDFAGVSSITVAHNLNSQNVFVQTFIQQGSEHRLIIPDQVRIIDNNTAIVELTSTSTGYIVVGQSGFIASGSIQNAVTASYVNNVYRETLSGDGGYTINHNLNEDWVLVQTYDSVNRRVVIPDIIESINSNTTRIQFATTSSVVAVIKK